MDGSAAHAVAARCRDELDARVPQRKLACRLPFLLANQPGHARDDEQEQDRRGDDDDQDVGVAELFCEADARSDQARDGEEAQPQRRQTRPDIRRRLVESAHRRVQRGCSPQDVVGDPTDVEAELMVVAVDEQGVGVRAVDDEQRDDAGDEQVEGRRALARRRPRAESPRRGAGCLRADRRSTHSWRAARARTDGCSARRGSPTRGAQTRRSGSARRCLPHDHRRGSVGARAAAARRREPDRRSGRSHRRATGIRRPHRGASGSCTCTDRRERTATGR